jgi:hypothetical protein
MLLVLYDIVVKHVQINNKQQLFHLQLYFTKVNEIVNSECSLESLESHSPFTGV